MSDDLTDALGRNIPLSEMIQTLRTELGSALEAGKNERLRFDIEHVDLELHVKIASKTEKNGKASFWVVGVDGSSGKADEAVHTFKLRLTPRLAGVDGPVRVSDTVSKLPS